jgi:hypothetical protein
MPLPRPGIGSGGWIVEQIMSKIHKTGNTSFYSGNSGLN